MAGFKESTGYPSFNLIAIKLFYGQIHDVYFGIEKHRSVTMTIQLGIE